MSKVFLDEEFGNWPERMHDLVRVHTDAATRGAAVAALLHECVPAAPVAACCLTQREGSALAVHPDDRWREEVEAWRQSRTVPEGGIELHSGSTHVQAEVAFLDGSDWSERWLLVGLPPRTAAAARSTLRVLMRLATAVLAAALRDEATNKASEGWLLLGEATSGLTHDLNNHLNSILLQAAVVQLKVNEAMRPEVEIIRQGALATATLLQPLQQFRDQRRQERDVVDLEHLLREMAGSLPIQTHAPLPALRMPAFELRRLLRHLLADRPDRIELSSDGQEVRMTLSPVVCADEEDIERLLRSQAVQSLVRLTGGTLHQEGTGTTITWPLEET